jgi:hypothetical protein
VGATTIIGAGVMGRGAGAEGGGDGGVTTKLPLLSAGAGGASSCASSGAAINSCEGSGSSWANRSRVCGSGSLNSGIRSTCPLVSGC